PTGLRNPVDNPAHHAATSSSVIVRTSISMGRAFQMTPGRPIPGAPARLVSSPAPVQLRSSF
ncbi:MAG: hypothetical protein ACRDQZ_02085, partial [Mycobacteriales bacterium]